jgi:hypothetical protein
MRDERRCDSREGIKICPVERQLLGLRGVRKDTVPAKILQFVSRGEQVRIRGWRNYAHWKSITKGLELFGPEERHRLFRQQAEHERADRAWIQRHHPMAEGAIVLPFSTPILPLSAGTSRASATVTTCR